MALVPVLVFAGLVMMMLPRRRRWTAMLVALMTMGAAGVMGCGPTAAPAAAKATITPTPAGTYVVTIQGLATINGAAVAHTATITYTVQ